MGSRYRPLEWLIQLTSIFFRVPPNLSVKLPRDSNAVHPHRCCTGKSDYNPDGEEEHTKLHPARSLQSDVKSASRNKRVFRFLKGLFPFHSIRSDIKFLQSSRLLIKTDVIRFLYHGVVFSSCFGDGNTFPARLLVEKRGFLNL